PFGRNSVDGSRECGYMLAAPRPGGSPPGTRGGKTTMRAFFVGLSLAILASTAGAQFVTFETGQVRPLALSPDQSKLFPINTPDARLEIFSIDGGTGALTHTGSVPVGMEPIAVAARTNTEVWVVNHLS